MFHKPIIQVDRIRRFLPQVGRERRVLNDISFTVEVGSWLALTGPSGSGKSALLAILGGIDRPTGGKVYIEGIETSALPEKRLARLRNEKIGMVFPSFHLVQTMTALENVEAPLYVHPQVWRSRSQAIHVLELVGLGERLNDFPHQLCGEEQQRVAIARALVCGPEILLADEPTGSLDANSSDQILDLIRRLRNSLGLTVVMVTRNPVVAARADDRLRIVAGRLVDTQRPGPEEPAVLAPLADEVRV